MEYSEWKVTLWRAFRSFVATLLALIGASLTQAATGVSIIGLDLSSWQGIAKTLAIPFAVAFLTALGKALRDKFGGENYEKMIDKIVI